MNNRHARELPAAFLMVCAFMFFMMSCSLGSTKISDILSHPREYAGKQTTISGEVTKTFSMIVVKYFVISDGSGEITVVTEKPLPAKGEKITVKGTVEEAFSLGPTTSLVLIESKE